MIPLLPTEGRSMRYQTEIHVSTDRYVCLQLPAFFPEGRARVTVTVDPEGVPAVEGSAGDDDRQDIEWWDEFEEGGTGHRA